MEGAKNNTRIDYSKRKKVKGKTLRIFQKMARDASIEILQKKKELKKFSKNKKIV